LTDIRLKEYADPAGVTMDWLLLDIGMLDERDELATAVRVALGSDAMASVDDVLPDPDSTDRRGWWGDMDTQLIWNGWPIGSRLWLLSRAKMTDGRAQQGSILTRVKFYIQEALQPFIDLKIASSMYVAVSRVDRQRINALVRLYRGPKTAIELQYQVLWQDIIE